MSNDGVCSFRVANRLSTLTSQSTAYVATIRQNQRDEKVDIPLSRYTADDRHNGVEMSDNCTGLSPASRSSSNSSHLLASLRYQANHSSLPPRNAWLHDKVSLKRATSASSVTERMVRINTDSDSAKAPNVTKQLPVRTFSLSECYPAFLLGLTPSISDRLVVTQIGVMHGKCRRTNERLGGLVMMKIEDLRHRRTEQGRLCGSCWRSLCIICRSRLFASVWPLQFLQKRGAGESLTGNQALPPAQDLRMNFCER